jgi:hypothetical protein
MDEVEGGTNPKPRRVMRIRGVLERTKKRLNFSANSALEDVYFYRENPRKKGRKRMLYRLIFLLSRRRFYLRAVPLE